MQKREIDALMFTEDVIPSPTALETRYTGRRMNPPCPSEPPVHDEETDETQCEDCGDALDECTCQYAVEVTRTMTVTEYTTVYMPRRNGDGEEIDPSDIDLGDVLQYADEWYGSDHYEPNDDEEIINVDSTW